MHQKEFPKLGDSFWYILAKEGEEPLLCEKRVQGPAGESPLGCTKKNFQNWGFFLIMNQLKKGRNILVLDLTIINIFDIIVIFCRKEGLLCRKLFVCVTVLMGGMIIG